MLCSRSENIRPSRTVLKAESSRYRTRSTTKDVFHQYLHHTFAGLSLPTTLLHVSFSAYLNFWTLSCFDMSTQTVLTRFDTFCILSMYCVLHSLIPLRDRKGCTFGASGGATYRLDWGVMVQHGKNDCTAMCIHMKRGCSHLRYRE